MIVINANEAKKPSGLAQLLLGNTTADPGKFARFLEAFEVQNNQKTGESKSDFTFLVEDGNEPSTPLLKEKSGKNSMRTVDQMLIQTEKKSLSREMTDVKEGKQTRQGSTLIQLLQGDQRASEVPGDTEVALRDDLKMLDPKLHASMTPEALKEVVVAAKTYLKEQITTIITSQQIDLKSMPQSLKGLSELADKLGLKLEKITLETLSVKSADTTLLKEPLPVLNLKQLAKPHYAANTRVATTTERAETSVPQPLSEVLREVKRSEHVLTTTREGSTAKVVETQVTQNTEVIKSASTVPQKETKTTRRETVVTTAATRQDSSSPIAPKPDEAQSTPSEKSPTANSVARRSTETQLTSLLNGIQPDEPSESVQEKPTVTESRITSVAPKSADALEVKVKEAQQTVRHFAADLKEAVENYKPPFTRLKMTLNPAKLGEVEVTMVQRGNNVHINVSSNNAALNLLAQNVTELKTQLANNGVVNTSMQFSTSHGEHQQQEGRHQQANQGYRSIEEFSDEEMELITSMEITLPQYV